MVDADVKEEIRRRVDIVDVVSAHVALKKSGRHYKGLCPFHQEKTPSFTVNRERGLFHCFGCGRGGDVFDFVMQTGNLTFPEALQELAKRAGVKLERTPDDRRRASEREQMHRAVDAAAQFYEAQLRAPAGKAARAHLEGRGVDAAAQERFRLGYAPDAWDALAQHLRGYPASVLEAAGLVNPRPQGGGHYDAFRHRVVFPILDLQDRPIAFGGRALGDGTPKYLNTRETPLFAKGRHLYALNWARGAIRDTGRAVVVEGYMDALTCHRFGIGDVVASLGTALTMDQAMLLRRFTDQVVLVYDPDAAGLAAMDRAMAVLEDAEMTGRVAVLPEGLDPDAFLRARGADAFRSRLDAAVPVFEYRLRQAASRWGTTSVEGKARLVDEMLEVLESVRNPVRRHEYLRLIAEQAAIGEDAVRTRVRRFRKAKTAAPAEEPPAVQHDRARAEAEGALLQLMVEDPVVRGRVRAVLAADAFEIPAHRAVAQAVFSFEGDDVRSLRDLVRDEAAQALLVTWLVAGEERPDRERRAMEYVEFLQRERIEARARELVQALGSLDGEALRAAQRELYDLRRRLDQERSGRIGVRRPGEWPGAREERATLPEAGSEEHGD